MNYICLYIESNDKEDSSTNTTSCIQNNEEGSITTSSMETMENNEEGNITTSSMQNNEEGGGGNDVYDWLVNVAKIHHRVARLLTDNLSKEDIDDIPTFKCVYGSPSFDWNQTSGFSKSHIDKIKIAISKEMGTIF